MSLPQVSRPMSYGARVYLITAALHFGLIGLSILAFPQMYGGPAFTAIVENTILLLWGIGFFATGLVCGAGAITKWPGVARVGLGMAFIVLIVAAFAVGWSVVGTWIDDDPALSSPAIPISFAALAVKDLLVVGRPLRSPVEDFEQARARLRSSHDSR